MFDTEGGWLHLSTEELVAGAKGAVAAGWGGVKVKIGKPDASEDLERLAAAREAVGPRFDLTASRRTRPGSSATTCTAARPRSSGPAWPASRRGSRSPPLAEAFTVDVCLHFLIELHDRRTA